MNSITPIILPAETLSERSNTETPFFTTKATFQVSDWHYANKSPYYTAGK